MLDAVGCCTWKLYFTQHNIEHPEFEFFSHLVLNNISSCCKNKNKLFCMLSFCLSMWLLMRQAQLLSVYLNAQCYIHFHDKPLCVWGWVGCALFVLCNTIQVKK